MPQSYTSLHYHVVFSTKGRARTITPQVQQRLYRYIGGILRQDEGQLLCIGGTGDHVHLLLRLHAGKALANAVRDIKASSSRWIHDTFPGQPSFAWQPGYSAFTVSFSGLDAVRRYIENQVEHHRRTSFDEELQRLCARHNITMDPRTTA